MAENRGNDKNSVLFMGLVTSFQQSALTALGKLVNPITGKMETDLSSAAAYIDMLDMLAEKTKGNLTSNESTTLEQIRSTLKLNYVEELNKSQKAESSREERKKVDARESSSKENSSSDEEESREDQKGS